MASAFGSQAPTSCYDGTMRRWYSKAAVVLLMAVTGLSQSQAALAYSGDVHQQLMFLAARQYNECVKDTPERRLSALQVRYAAKAAVRQSEASFFRRMFRWSFYEREKQSPKSMLWVVETRLHEHFNSLTRQLIEAETDAEQFSVAGRIATYVQDVTSPVRVVPIYTARFWRFNTSDRFDNYPVANTDLIRDLDTVCDTVLNGSFEDFSDVLRKTADKSLRAIVEPIPGMPTTWQSFWRLAKNPSDFGEYGRAGNRFGNSTSFKCGDERCVLLNDDPLYAEFAAARHTAAILGTMQVLHMLQQARVPTPPPAVVPPINIETDAAPSETEDADESMAKAQARNITANE